MVRRRWGNAKSPAYGTLSDYQFMRRHSSSAKALEKARAAWGASLSSIDDVIKVFVNYCSGCPHMPALVHWKQHHAPSMAAQ